MNDRLVEYPNRYRLQAVEGESDIYDLIPAPGIVTEEGTPLNKSTIFNDTVSARYGLEDGTPSAAFGRTVQVLTAAIPASGWSSAVDADGWYTNQVKAAYNPLMDLVITSAALAEDERAAFGLIMECETFDGYVLARALEVPELDINVRFVGV